MKAIFSRDKLFIAASALLMLTLSSSAFEIFPGYAGQRRHRLRNTVADDIQPTNSRALEENQLLPNDADEQSTGIASTSSTSPTMESSDMPTYDDPTTTSFTSFIPTYSPSTSSTSIKITLKNNPQSAPTKVTSLKSPPSATKKQTPPTKVTSSANSTSTKSSKSTAKSSKSVSNETCPSGCSYVCESVTLGKSSKSKSSKASSNDTALDFRTAYSSTYEEMSSIEGSCLCGYCMDCSSLPVFEQLYCNDSCMFVQGSPKPSVLFLKLNTMSLLIAGVSDSITVSFEAHKEGRAGCTAIASKNLTTGLYRVAKPIECQNETGVGVEVSVDYTGDGLKDFVLDTSCSNEIYLGMEIENSPFILEGYCSDHNNDESSEGCTHMQPDMGVNSCGSISTSGSVRKLTMTPSFQANLVVSRMQVNATNSQSYKAKSSKSSTTDCTYSSKSSTSKSSKSMSINATNLTDSFFSKSSKSISSKSSESDCNCSCQCTTPNPTFASIASITKPSLSPSTMVIPCAFCTNGVTFPNQVFHGSLSDGHPKPKLFTLTCAQANVFAVTQIKSDRDCATFKLSETACCPPTSMPALNLKVIASSISPSTAPTSSSQTTDKSKVLPPSMSAPTTSTPTAAIPSGATTAIPSNDPTTSSPTSLSPTSVGPGTSLPTSVSPTTALSTTPSTATPKSENPNTSVPSTSIPNTSAPSTSAKQKESSPTSVSPTNAMPSTLAPTSMSPTTAIPSNDPTTSSPTSLSPITAGPSTSVPNTSVPSTTAPTSASPITSIPSTTPSTTTPSSVSLTTALPSTLPSTSDPTSANPTTAIPNTTPSTLSPTSVNSNISVPSSSAPSSSALSSSAPSAFASDTFASTSSPTTDSCVPYTVDWDNSAIGTEFINITLLNNTTKFTNMSMGGITMSLNSPSFYGGCNASALDRTIQSGPFGNGIMFDQKPAINGGQIITFSFSHMVYNYSFLLTDIDSGLDDNEIFGWSDRIVFVNPTSYTYTLPTGSSVIGNGTSVEPFRNSNDFNQGGTSSGGNIFITIPGPLMTFTFDLSSTTRGKSSSQQITLGNLAFKDCGESQ